MIKVANIERFDNKKLVVTIGADDPNELMEAKTADKALRAATKRGFKEILNIGDVHCFGQNRLATRKFTFIR